MPCFTYAYADNDVIVARGRSGACCWVWPCHLGPASAGVHPRLSRAVGGLRPLADAWPTLADDVAPWCPLVLACCACSGGLAVWIKPNTERAAQAGYLQVYKS